ncbi:MAG: hypothetical protein C4516_03350 [Oxalobacter sp.]|nr:MAG: hypothetical protein C4516_03350 [Oxalobacter sp.]
MNDPAKSPESSQAREASVHAQLAAPSSFVASPQSSVQKFLIAAVVILAVLLGVQWWSSRYETGKLKKELARRLQAGDTTNVETKNLTSSLQEGMKQLQTRVAGLEAKQVEAQAQQLALAELYQELSKSRDDWVLSEIEQVLTTANQQLHLSRNVQGALIALQNADRSLARQDKPQFTAIRRAIDRDINRLKSLPSVDITGTVLRIDSVIGQIDRLPLYADEKPAIPPLALKNQQIVTPAQTGKPTAGESVRMKTGEFWNSVQNKWQSWSSEVWQDLRQLVRVRNVEQPDALLVSPEQAYFIRENLKLRLLNARLALLSRSEATFRSDMVIVQEALNKYFDPLAKQTQAARTILKQVQLTNVSIEMPTLESLAAVHNFKTKP